MSEPGTTYGSIVSVDDHLIEPPDIFERHCSEKTAQFAPQWVERDGKEGWLIDDWFCGVSKAAVAAGGPWGQAEIFGAIGSVPRDLSDPRQRLAAMDRDNVVASLCFPSFVGLGGETLLRIQDRAVRRDCVRAYNRFLVNEWCAADPKRLIPAIILPLDDPMDCVAEVGLWAPFGIKAVVFPEAPHALGLPPIWDRHWDPLWGVLSAAGLPIVVHTLSDDVSKYMTLDIPYWGLTMARTSAIETMGAWLLTPVLDRWPGLRVMIAESGIGWIPWFLNLCNTTYAAHKFEFGMMKTSPMEKAEQSFGLAVLPEPMLPTMIDLLPGGLAQKLMLETDYPHLDGSFPNSLANLRSYHLPHAQAAGLARHNAIRFFKLEDVPYA